MRKVLAISFLVLYCVTSTELNQLLKIRLLIEHFNEHKTLDEGVSLADFLYMHYTDHDINDNDQDKDMQLPFKSHSDCSSLTSTAFLTQQNSLHLCLAPVLAERITVYKRSDFQSSYLSSIWQPPKFC